MAEGLRDLRFDEYKNSARDLFRNPVGAST